MDLDDEIRINHQDEELMEFSELIGEQGDPNCFSPPPPRTGQIAPSAIASLGIPGDLELDPIQEEN